MLFFGEETYDLSGLTGSAAGWAAGWILGGGGRRGAPPGGGGSGGRVLAFGCGDVDEEVENERGDVKGDGFVA